MKHLIGTYECKADIKGRIMMPIAIKKQLSSLINESFVLKRAVFNPCLELYPLQEWTLLMEKVNGLNRFNKKNNDFIRRFTSFSHPTNFQFHDSICFINFWAVSPGLSVFIKFSPTRKP